MMNGVRDRVHQFAADRGRDQWRRVGLVVYLASHVDWAIEKRRWDRFERAQDSVCFRERELAIIFDSRISTA